MIAITRLLARQLQTVIRRALNVSSRSPLVPVTFQTGSDGLRVRAQTHDAAVEYLVPGSFEDCELVAPLELLNDCKGTKQDEVQLETVVGERLIASWNDGFPQIMRYNLPTHLNSSGFPGVPEIMAENPSSLLTALHDAMETSDADAIRYSLNHIQLDGTLGRIAATDGRHILVRTSFDFPWDGPALIPHRTVFACKEIANGKPVFVGRTEDWVTVGVEPWTVHLRIEKEGRYPDVNDHIRRPNDALAKLCVSDSDAGFLTKALKSLPSADEFNSPATVDLNGAAVIRAQSDEDQSPTEVLLSTSTVSGDAIRFNTNRHYLGRALKMGFREVSLYGVEAPAICNDGERHYVWALLGKDGIIKPSKDATRIASQEDTQVATTQPHETRSQTTMAQTKATDNGKPASSNSKTDESVGVDAVIENAEALKVSLRDSLAKTSELIVSLKRHKKANKSVQTALASLRQLQTLDA